MTREEFIEELFDQLEDESEDVLKYHMLCGEAKKHGMHHLAKGLKSIADDEYTHAKYIAEFLGEEAEQPIDAPIKWHKWHQMMAEVKSK